MLYVCDVKEDYSVFDDCRMMAYKRAIIVHLFSTTTNNPQPINTNTIYFHYPFSLSVLFLNISSWVLCVSEILGDFDEK